MESMIFTYSGSTTGANHVAAGRPCQDRSFAGTIAYGTERAGVSIGRHATVLIVSDGHGSAEHYRSATGAELALDAVKEAIPYILEVLDARMPAEGVAVSRGVAPASVLAESDRTDTDPHFESVARMFFTRISALWAGKVLAHISENPLETESLQGPAHPYGCTLIGAAITDRYWFAFQLGDGAVIGVGADGRTLTPVPGDSRCRYGRTTSMSRHGAGDFRYAYSTEMPAALLLCTDGISDGIDDPQALAAGIIGPIAERLMADGSDKLAAEIDASLPEMSAAYGGDDVSIALWMDCGTTGEVLEALRAQNIAVAFREYTTTKRELVLTEKSISDIEERLSYFLSTLESDAESIAADAVRDSSTLSSLQRRQRQLLDDLDNIVLGIENFEQTGYVEDGVSDDFDIEADLSLPDAPDEFLNL